MWSVRRLSGVAAAVAVVGVSAIALTESSLVTPSSSSCTTTISAGSLSTAMNSAAAGSTVCLNAGAYTYTGATINKSSMVTAQPAAGVAQSAVTVGYIDLQTSNNLRFKDMTVAGSGMNATNVQFVGIAFTGGVCVAVPGTNSARGILIDSSTFVGLSDQACGNEGRLTINGQNTAHTSGYDQGIVISNNTFGPGGCADGIHLTGEAQGATITGNTFTGIKQGACAPAHVDPIQFYGARYMTIRDNWFKSGNSTGIMSADCNGSPMKIINNVFHSDGEYRDQVVLGGSDSDLVEHNTFVNSQPRVGIVNSCGNSLNSTFRNNVFTSDPNFTTTGGAGTTQSAACPGCTWTFNLATSSSVPTQSAGGVVGSPVYAGGATPSTWAGFTLAAGSPGYNVGSDSTSMGIVP